MCYSTQTSLVAWVLSVSIAAYLWKRNNKYDRWNASFIWTFSAVQLWEAGIWSSTNKSQQALFLKLIALTLTAQPLVQTFGAWKTTGEKSQFLRVMLIVYGLIWLYTLYRVFTEHFSVSIGPNGHLVWNASDGGMVNGPFGILGVLYLAGLFLGLMYFLPTSIPLILVGIATIIFSLSRVSSQEFASFWCLTALFYSLTAVFTGV